MNDFRVPDELEQYRIVRPPWGAGNRKNGLFHISCMGITVTATEGKEWQCVTLSRDGRMPNFADLDYVKNLFWDRETVVLYYHTGHDSFGAGRNSVSLWRPLRWCIDFDSPATFPIPEAIAR